MSILFVAIAQIQNQSWSVTSFSPSKQSLKKAVETTLQHLSTTASQQQTRSFETNDANIHVLALNGTAYACITEKMCPNRTGFSCLDMIESQYRSNNYPSNPGSILANVLQQVNRPNFDKIALAQTNIDEVKSEVLSAVDKILTNSDALTTAVESTNTLQFSANQYRKKSKQLEVKQLIVLFSLLGILVYILFVIAVILIIVFLIFLGIVKLTQKDNESS